MLKYTEAITLETEIMNLGSSLAWNLGTPDLPTSPHFLFGYLTVTRRGKRGNKEACTYKLRNNP